MRARSQRKGMLVRVAGKYYGGREKKRDIGKGCWKRMPGLDEGKEKIERDARKRTEGKENRGAGKCCCQRKGKEEE